MIILITIPAIPMVSGFINTYGINIMSNQIELEQEYIIVMPDIGLNEKQKEQSLNMITIINIAGLFWILIFLLKILLIFYKLLYLHKFRKRLKIIKTQKFNTSISKIFGKKNKSKIPDIYLSSLVHSPVAFGLLKPIIVIPEKIYNKLQEQELKGIVFHEMSHIIRYDHISGLIQQIILSFYWWNPFIYKISREFSIASEYISDNFAIRATSPRLYANTLISLIEKTNILNKMPGLTGISSPHIDLKERIKKIIQKERKMETKLKNYLTLIIIIISIVVLGLLSGQNFIFAKSKIVENTEKVLKAEKVQKTKKTESASKENDQEENIHELSIRQARRTKYIAPIYPSGLIKAKAQGIVRVKVIVGIDGKIKKLKVISGHPLFNGAAVKAIKQWEYKPYKKDGKLIPVSFKVTIRFTIGRKSKNSQAKRIKYVKPEYPEIAKKSRISGIVIIKATTDTSGNVINCRIISGHPLLNSAARNAVYKWKYAPYIVNGKKKEVTFTVTVRFTNTKKEKKKK